MGINVSRQPPNQINDILKPYNIKERNSNYQLYENPQTRHQVERWCFQFPDEEAMKKKEKSISIQKILNSPSHLTIIAYQALQIPEFCFTQYSVQVLCEHPIQDFQTYLEVRGQNEFSEAELWHLIDCMTSAQKNEYFYLDAMNIYQASEDVWKIRAFEPNESPIMKYAHNLKVDEKNRFPHMYPSPEELKTLNPSDESKKQKSTVFTFGMLLLHLALATSCDSLYQNQQINEASLKERIKLLQQKYNPQLAHLIQNMLIFNLIDRYDYLQIGKQLQICNKSNLFEKEKQSIAHYSQNQPIVEIKPQTQLPIQIPNQYYQLASPQTIQNNSSVQQFQSTNQVTSSQKIFYPTQQNQNFDPLASNNTANFLSQFPNLSLFPNQQLGQSQTQRQEIIQNSNPSFRVSQVPEVHSNVVPSNYQKNNNFNVSQMPEGISNYLPSQFVTGAQPQNNQALKNKLKQPDGKLYEGSILNNKMNGEGTLFYPNGELCYKGIFQDGNFHEFGEHYNQGYVEITGPLSYQDFAQIDQYWKFYEGDFNQGYREGIGNLYFSNGEHYTGTFAHNLPHGTGAFYKSDKQSIHGVWERGKLVRII